MGGGGGWGAVGGLKQTFSAVPPVGDPAWHNSPGRPSLLSESVWHPMQSY